MTQIKDLAVVLALVPVIKDGKIMWDVSMQQMNGSSTDGVFDGKDIPEFLRSLISVTEAAESLRRLLDD